MTGMRRRSAIVLLLGLAFATACRGPGDSQPASSGDLETVEVGAPPDALVDPESDPVERRRAAEALAGILPSDFPEALPTPEAASVVDLGERAVVFLVPRSPSTVRPRYASRLRGRGWAEDGEGAFRRNDVRIGVTFEREGPSTRITVTY